MSEPVRLGGRRAIVVWGTAVAVYFLAIFHRSSLGVAGLAAAERFHITASQLSTFTVLQLLVYAAMQIPVGVLLDRFGPQRLLVAGAVFMTLAQLGFAFTGSYSGALVARVFVGMGDAMVFISVLRLIASWFPPVRSPMVTSFTAMIGQSGALIAAIPLSRALASYGWTTTFVASASVGVLLGLLIVLLVRDVPPGAPSSRSTKDVRTVGRDLRLAWLDPGTRLGLWSHFTTQFAANVMGLLWGFPFFVHAEHRSEAEAGGLLSLLVGVFIVGGPLIGGYITRHPWRRSTIVLSVVGAMMVTWTVVLLWPGDAPLWLLCLLVVTTGLGGPGLDDRLRPGADVCAGLAAGAGQRDRQRRRVHGLAAGRARHRPGARRDDAGCVDRLRRRGVQVGDVRAVPLLGRRWPPGLALPLPRPRAPRCHPARDVPGHERAGGVRQTLPKARYRAARSAVTVAESRCISAASS